jgi:hypothetical protein
LRNRCWFLRPFFWRFVNIAHKSLRYSRSASHKKTDARDRTYLRGVGVGRLGRLVHAEAPEDESAPPPPLLGAGLVDVEQDRGPVEDHVSPSAAARQLNRRDLRLLLLLHLRWQPRRRFSTCSLFDFLPHTHTPSTRSSSPPPRSSPRPSPSSMCGRRKILGGCGDRGGRRQVGRV